MHQNAHVIDHRDDIFDLLRIDNLLRQMVVYLGVGQESLVLTFFNQELESGLLSFVHSSHVAARVRPSLETLKRAKLIEQYN